MRLFGIPFGKFYFVFVCVWEGVRKRKRETMIKPFKCLTAIDLTAIDTVIDIVIDIEWLYQRRKSKV